MSLDSAIADAVYGGLAAAVLVDHRGNVVSRAGAVEDDELRVLAHVLMSLSGDERARRLFAGELLAFPLDGRETFVGVAGRRLFVVAVAEIGAPPAGAKAHARALLDEVACVLEATSEKLEDQSAPPRGGSSGPASAPASLRLGDKPS